MMCDHVLQLLTTTVEEMEGVRSSLYNRFFSVGKDIVIGFLYELDVIFVISVKSISVLPMVIFCILVFCCF